MRDKYFLGLSFLFALLISGCGYSLVGKGSNLPSDIRRIHVSSLENETQRQQVEQILTQAIIDELVTRRRFEIVNTSEEADAILSGKVTSFAVRPLTFDDEGLADNYEISITADMEFSRPPSGLEDTGEVIWKNARYLFREDYPLEQGDDGYFDREQIAIAQTAAPFAATLVTDLLEGF